MYFASVLFLGEMGRGYARLPFEDNQMEQTALLPDGAPEFTEVSLHGRQDFSAAPAAVLHIGTVTVELFEDTSRELLEAIMKAVRSC